MLLFCFVYLFFCVFFNNYVSLSYVGYHLYKILRVSMLFCCSFCVCVCVCVCLYVYLCESMSICVCMYVFVCK